MQRLAMVALLSIAACRTPHAPEAVQPQGPDTLSIQRDNDERVREVLASITGKEQLPAGQVFTNVKFLAGTNARTMVGIMNGGYAKALGVRCTHCHVEGDYASDDKRPKRAAREMQTMHRMINQQLGQMKEIKTPATANRAINCALCHRGSVIPRS